MLKLSFGIGSRVRVQAGVRIRALGLDLVIYCKGDKTRS